MSHKYLQNSIEPIEKYNKYKLHNSTLSHTISIKKLYKLSLLYYFMYM